MLGLGFWCWTQSKQAGEEVGMMKDNRPLPKTNGVVKEINVFEVAPLKLVTFRLTFAFRLRYAGCFSVCAKSAISLRETGLWRRCLPRGVTPVSLPSPQSLSQCWSSPAHAALADFLLDSKCVWACRVVQSKPQAQENQHWNWDKLPLSREE